MFLLLFLGLLTASVALADQPPSLTKIGLPGFSSPEGMAVNPVTHKAYIIAEAHIAEDSDGQKVVLVINTVPPTTYPPKMIAIPNESEYIAIDSVRNLIYVSTKFDLAEEESDGSDTDNEVDASGLAAVTALGAGTLGTLTVIDGFTDTVIATWNFPEGVEPEGVAVDTGASIVYVAAKAPEGESSIDDTCSSGTPIPDVGEPADVECWTAGSIYAFFIDARFGIPPFPRIATVQLLKVIPAGDDPESLVFANGMVYAANEDDGTVTIASAVHPDGTGGGLLTETPRPPTQPYESGIAPYSLGVFYYYGPNPLACIENKFEADKMAAGGGSVFITDDRSRVAKITGTAVVGMRDVPGATVCEEIPNSDGGGANTANNIAFMQTADGQFLYVVSEQNTVAIYDPVTMQLRATVPIPEARHLDAIGVDGAAKRVWITDEELQAVFVLQGSCATGTATCAVETGGAPLITGQPMSQTVTPGQTATFMANAVGNPTPTVQWQRSTNNGASWLNIPGATSTSYTTASAITAMNGYQYRAVFTNTSGSISTNAATLTVNAASAPPAVTTQPSSQAVTAGQTATFTAAANGSPSPTVQWQISTLFGFAWPNIPGATNTSYTTPATTTAMNGYRYRTVFTNSAGTASSSAAVLTVTP